MTARQKASDQTVVAEHTSGSLSDPKALNDRISIEWNKLIDKPGKKTEIAERLGVSEEKISNSIPPFEAIGGPSGIIETTILILLAKGFVTGVGVQAGKATFDYLRSLWTEVAKPLEDPRTETIGPPVVRDYTLDSKATQRGQERPPR